MFNPLTFSSVTISNTLMSFYINVVMTVKVVIELTLAQITKIKGLRATFGLLCQHAFPLMLYFHLSRIHLKLAMSTIHTFTLDISH